MKRSSFAGPRIKASPFALSSSLNFEMKTADNPADRPSGGRSLGFMTHAPRIFFAPWVLPRWVVWGGPSGRKKERTQSKIL